MTIERVDESGNSLVFELTSRELYDAFLEQQFLLDRNDCEGMIYGFTDAQVMECYGVDKAGFYELLDDMAMCLRRNIDKYDMTWEYARDDAVRTVIERSARTPEN